MSLLYKLALAGTLFVVLVVSIVDVTGRYLFNAPLLGADDLIRLGMAIIVFGGLPAVSRSGEHISVDLISGHLGAKLRRLAGRIWSLVAAAVLLYLAWRLIDLGRTAAASGDRSPLLLLPYAPLMFFMAACAAAAALTELAAVIRPRSAEAAAVPGASEP